MSFAPQFETLVRQHYRAAYAVAFAIMRNHADAEDVCHDAFVRAGVNLEQCRDLENFAAWLCTIVRNTARNHLDKQRVRRTEPLDHARASVQPRTDNDIAEQLTAALNQLSEVQRTVVLLHDMDGWSHEEIAQQIGSSAGMSRQHLFKARQRLREIIGIENYVELRSN